LDIGHYFFLSIFGCIIPSNKSNGHSNFGSNSRILKLLSLYRKSTQKALNALRKKKKRAENGKAHERSSINETEA